MIGFAKRNLKIFFKDRTAVFFSLLAVFIVIGLYALFLGDVMLRSFTGLEGVEFLMNSWIIAGLLAVTSVTTTMGAFGIMVDDKIKKISKDFTASPLKSSSIAGGYIFSSFIIGVIMSFVTLFLAEIYVIANGGELLSFTAFIKVIGIIFLGTFTSTAMVLFMVTFFKSANAFATASTIIGTLIGFLTGIYLPIGDLPEAVQWVVKLFPISHTAALFRQVIMETPMAVSFENAPAEAIAEFEQTMGVAFSFGDTIITPLMSIGILVLTSIIFFGLSIVSVSAKKK